MQRTLTWLMSAALLGLLVASGGATAQNDTNRGTVKIHDDLVTDPEERNEPRVSCDFYVQGFNFNDPDGYLLFQSWPPTGDKEEVTPTGDTLLWTGTPDGDGEYDFLKGAYSLPAGHYRLEVYTNDGHPGHNEGHFAKSKMFWVDPCEGEQPPCVDDPETEVDECEETEIPFFPGFTSLALGSLGALAMVGLALRRRS